MQIGNYDENDNFNPILYSNGIIVDSKYRYEPGDLGPGAADWTVLDFYTINPVMPVSPEPSSGILFLLGASLLALKRKSV